MYNPAAYIVKANSTCYSVPLYFTRDDCNIGTHRFTKIRKEALSCTVIKAHSIADNLRALNDWADIITFTIVSHQV